MILQFEVSLTRGMCCFCSLAIVRERWCVVLVLYVAIVLLYPLADVCCWSEVHVCNARELLLSLSHTLAGD